MPDSYAKFREDIKAYIESKCPIIEGKDNFTLDVGAGNGMLAGLLNPELKTPHVIIEAIEPFAEYIELFKLKEKYEDVFKTTAQKFFRDYIYWCGESFKYDVIYFGDVIEHMTIEDATFCIEEAVDHSYITIVAIPYMFRQGSYMGNELERHIQDDLTEEIFLSRYPMGFTKLFGDEHYGVFVIINENNNIFEKWISDEPDDVPA
jgi:hypothetical protein